MTEPLRPMSTSQLLDRTISLYRKHFLLFVAMASVGPAAGVVFQMITVGSRAVPTAGRHAVSPFARFNASLLLGWIILLAGMAIANAGTVKAVAAVHLGQNISIMQAYGALRGRILRVLGIFFSATMIAGLAATLVTFLAALVLGIVLMTDSAASQSTSFTGIVFATVFGVIAIFLVIYIRYALAIQACVVEDLGVRASLKRSVQLSKGSRWRIVAMYLVFLTLNWIAAYGLRYIALKTGTVLHNRTAARTLIYLAGFIAGSTAGPLATIGLSLLYYDERVRKEAFDLQLMVLSLDALPSPVESALQVAEKQTVSVPEEAIESPPHGIVL